MLLLYIKFVVWKMNQPLLRWNNSNTEKKNKKNDEDEDKKMVGDKRNPTVFSWWAL